MKKIITTLVGAFCLALFCGCAEDHELSSHLMKASLFEVINGQMTVERLNSIASSAERDSNFFVITHVSDAHFSDYSDGNNISFSRSTNLGQAVAFANRDDVGADAMVHTGDMINNSSSTSRDEALKLLRKFVDVLYENNNVPTFFVNGNHDSNRMSHNPNKYVYSTMIYSLLPISLRAKMKTDDSRCMYFYYDVPGPKDQVFRFIGLDMCDDTDDDNYDTQHWAYYSQKQIDWLTNVALKEGMTENHYVIILNHFAFCPTGDAYETYLNCSYYVHSWKMIPEIVEAYRMRKSLTKTYAHNLGGKDMEVNADFTDAKGTFVCHLAGHNHTQQQFDVEGLDFEAPNLPKQHMILCTNMSPSEKCYDYNIVERVPYSLSSNAFNVYMVDAEHRTVHMTYFGAYDHTKPLIDKFEF